MKDQRVKYITTSDNSKANYAERAISKLQKTLLSWMPCRQQQLPEPPIPRTETKSLWKVLFEPIYFKRTG